MDCKTATELLSDFLDGRLEQARSREMAAHIDACGQCRLELERMRKTVDLLRGLPYVPAASGMTARILESTARPAPGFASAPEKTARLRSWMPLMRGIGAAAVIMIFAYMGHRFMEDESRSRAPAPASISKSAETGRKAAPAEAALEKENLLGVIEAEGRDMEESETWDASPDAPARLGCPEKAETSAAKSKDLLKEDDESLKKRAVSGGGKPEARKQAERGKASLKPEPLDKTPAPPGAGPAPSATPAGAGKPAAPPAASAEDSLHDAEEKMKNDSEGTASPAPERASGFAGVKKDASGQAPGAQAGKAGAAPARALPVTLVINSSDPGDDAGRLRSALASVQSRRKLRSAAPAADGKQAPADSPALDKGGENAEAEIPEALSREVSEVLKRLEEAAGRQAWGGRMEDQGATDTERQREGSESGGFVPAAPHDAVEYEVRLSLEQYRELKSELGKLRARFWEIPSQDYRRRAARRPEAAKSEKPDQGGPGKDAPEAPEDLKAADKKGAAGSPEQDYVVLTIRIVREEPAANQPAPAPARPPGSGGVPAGGSAGEPQQKSE